MDNKGGIQGVLTMFAVIFVMVIVAIVVLQSLGFLAVTGGAPGAPPGEKPEFWVDASACPDDGDTSFIVQMFNSLNDTGAETFDVTGYLYQQDPETGEWDYVTSLTDFTNPSAVTIDCGYRYRLCTVAADADGGDNSVIKAIKTGTGYIDSMGCAVFEAKRSNVYVNLDGEQHDVLNFRMYDNVDARYAYDSGDASNTDWEADGVIFRDGDNATAFAVGSGGYLDFCIELKSPTTDEDFADAYVLVLIEAPLDKWNEPTVTYDGTVLEDIKDSGLTPEESDAFSSYEYVYKITGDIKDKVHKLCVYMEACSGCDPTADVEVDFASAGNYLSVDGVTVKQGAAKDDSANTAVFTIQDVTIDVS